MTPGPKARPIADRFWEKVDRSGPTQPHMESPCWVWKGTVTKQGYGHFKAGGRNVRAHRISYEMASGPIPRDTFACHRCDTPSCVRPDHIFIGTPADNTADMRAKQRERHPSGDAHHSRLHPENLARGDRNGSRLHPERVVRGDAHASRTRPERRPRGEGHARAKLTEAAVREIRAKSAAGGSQMSLAREFCVSGKTISNVVKRLQWRHVV